MDKQKTTGDRISELKEFPKDTHFAALRNSSFYGDDGYGERTSHTRLEYIYLGNREQAIGWMQSEEAARDEFPTLHTKYIIIEVKPLTITRTINFGIE